MTKASPIRSEAEYEAALARAEELMDARAGTPEAAELRHLAMVIETYEEKHHPIELPFTSPIEDEIGRLGTLS